MLIVKPKIGKSKIEGVGLFADQFIPKRTVVWKFDPRFDIYFDTKEVEEMAKDYRAIDATDEGGDEEYLNKEVL
mgnify:CR=1 FL=1|jgi:hypothetical protein